MVITPLLGLHTWWTDKRGCPHKRCLNLVHIHSVARHRNIRALGWSAWKEQSWWRHQMETFSTLLVICAGNSPVTGEFPAQRPVTRCFDVFFDLRLNERLNKQSWGWWFEMPPRSLWRYSNGNKLFWEHWYISCDEAMSAFLNSMRQRGIQIWSISSWFHDSKKRLNFSKILDRSNGLPCKGISVAFCFTSFYR